MTAPGPLVPRSLRSKYEGWEWAIAWQLAPELVTYRLEGPHQELHFVKVMPLGRYPTLAAEAKRMVWARDYLPVPVVLDSGSDQRVEWLVTQGLPGRDGTHPSLQSDPRHLVRVLAEGLRRLHEVPTSDCPFDSRLDVALGSVRQRLEAGVIDPAADFHHEHQHLGAEVAVQLLHQERPNSEDLVVCHGDYCPPNVLIDRGMVAAYLDLGELGVADRWWDLAVGSWAVTWNLGPGHEDAFFAAYGVEVDPDRRRYYRLLYDLAS